MTKESVEVLTEIFENRLWEDYSSPADKAPILNEIEDNMGLFSQDINFYAALVKEFDSAKEAEDYFSKIDDIRMIHVTRSIEVGGVKISRDGQLFGPWYIINEYMILNVARQEARDLADTQYWYDNHHGRIVSADFLRFFGRNNGKHWDDLVYNTDEEEEE